MFSFHDTTKKSISLKLLLYILAFSAFVTLFTTAIHVYLDFSIELDLIEKRISNIQKSNLKSLSQSLWYLDTNYAKTQLNGLLQLPAIQYLRITSDIEQNNMSAGTPQTDNRTTYEFPLIYQEGAQKYDLGTIQIVVDLNYVYQQVFNRVLIILATQALKTFFVSGFIFFIVQWLITRHLKKISNFIQQSNIENLDQVLQLDLAVKEDNELNQVVDAINFMRGELNKKVQSSKRRIFQLGKGATSIREGDLTFRLDTKGLKDELEELGDLAVVFNQMAATIDQRETKLKKMNAELEKKNRELDEFTYIASHDLQEPLRKLTAFSKLLETDMTGELNRRAQEDLAYIIEASDRMKTLIQDLLELSRTGRKTVSIQKINLNLCVSGIKSLFMDKIEASNATFIVADLPEIDGDKTLIEQLFQNLIQNALKYNDKEIPVIEITYEKENGRSIFGVKDNGIGIKPEYQEQIFQPFKRLHGRYEYSGTGIGLSICKKTVEKHSGEIWVESKPDEYTHFRFTLNTQKEHKENEAQQTSDHSVG